MKWILMILGLFLILLSVGFAYSCCVVSGSISRLEEERNITKELL